MEGHLTVDRALDLSVLPESFSDASNFLRSLAGGDFAVNTSRVDEQIVLLYDLPPFSAATTGLPQQDLQFVSRLSNLAEAVVHDELDRV